MMMQKFEEVVSTDFQFLKCICILIYIYPLMTEILFI